MGQQQSKDELLYQQVNYGNVEGIKTLRSEGAGLEWIDREGKTALIAACMSSELYNVAKTLIELGAKVNAYRPGRHAGTPLHHAAKRGLDQTVKLLLSQGANALVMNDDCQTPLDVARSKGYTNVVRTIENHICLFSGWLREFYGPGFLELFAPQLLTRRVWVVVLPCGSRNLNKPFKLELAIYSSVQDAQPRTLIALWKANLEEPNWSHPDPTAIISDIPNIPVPPIPRCGRRRRGALSSRVARCDPRGGRQTRIKLAAVSETDKPQLQRFCNACKGIPQVIHQNFPFIPQAPPMPAPATSSAEDVELAMAINASLQSAAEPRPPYPSANLISNASTSSNHPAPSKASSSGSQAHEIGSSSNQTQNIKNHGDIPSTAQLAPEIPVPTPLPSAPPIDDVAVDDGPINYPSIDFSPIDFSTPAVENSSATAAKDEKKEVSADSISSTCVICLDAPAEGACIPCGHMAGCMSCLNEIKGKKWGCPVCRAKIDQVIRVYAV